MNNLKYIPGDLVMTNGRPIGTAKDVVYRVVSSDPSKTLKLDDETTLKGSVYLENLEGAEFGEKGYLLGDCCAWVKDIVPIPITQKFLCKNKWKANAINYDYSINDKLFFCAFPTDRKAGCVELDVYNNIAPSDSYDVCQDDFYLGNISFVHQLQHLLFGLGLNSEIIEINIKCCLYCKHAHCKVYLETYHCDIYNKDFYPHELCGDDTEKCHFESEYIVW